jgi:entericidin A
MQKLIITLVSLVWLAALGGCNTVEGIGKDVKKAGSTIEEAAAKKK